MWDRRGDSTATPRSGRRLSWLPRLAFQVSVTLAFALLALRTIDTDTLRATFDSVTLWWIAPALLLFTAAKYVDSWRWRYLLSDVTREAAQPPPQAGLFGAFLIGNMVNNLLPLRAGDLAKVQVLANRYGASRAGVAATVFVVEATLDGLVFVIFLVAAVLLWELGDLPGVSVAAIVALVVVAATALVVALAAARGRLAGSTRVAALLPARWAAAARAQLLLAGAGLAALRTWPRMAGAVALSVPAWLVEAGMFALMGRAFGIDHSYPTFVAVMVSANLAVAIPIALWNFGPYETLVTGVLAAAGTNAASALSYALTVHVLTNAWIIATGIIAFWVLRVRPAEVFALHRAAQACEDPSDE